MPSLFKQPIFRSRKLLDAARGKSCIRCGRDDGTVVPAHYSGIQSHRLGKGAGIKASDAAVADLCLSCHAAMDSYAAGNDYERGFEFLLLILLTIIRRIEDGVLVVK